MNCNKDQAESTLEQMENYARERETKLKDYNEVVAERDEMQNRMKIGLELLDSMENKQTCMFNKLVGEHNKLCNEHDFKFQQLQTFHDENEFGLRINEERLNNKLNEQEVFIKNVIAACSTLDENAQKLQDQLLHINATIDNSRAIQKQTELKLNDTDQQIIRVQNTIAEKMARREKMQNIIHAELRKTMTLPSSKSDTKIENEKIVKSLQTELSTVKNQLNEKVIELVNIKDHFVSKEHECDMQNEQSKQLKKNIYDIQIVYEKEKCSANEEIYSLQAEAKSLGTKLKLINTNVLCDAQTENDKLERELKDQNSTINELMLIEEQLRRDVKQNKQAVKLAQQKLVTERKQRVNETKLRDKKMLMKAQEKCELQQTIENQVRQIKKLKMEMAAIKPTAITHNAQTTFTSALNMCLELSNDEDQIPTINQCC